MIAPVINMAANRTNPLVSGGSFTLAITAVSA